jgi:hypothetical protein
VEGLDERHVRRCDYLVHVAGRGQRGDLLNEWSEMLNKSDDVWEKDRAQRNVSSEVQAFGKISGLGYEAAS